MPTPFARPVDDFRATLAAPYVAGSGTLALQSGKGSALGALGANQFYRLVAVLDSGTSAEAILNVFVATSLSGDTLSGVAADTGYSDASIPSVTGVTLEVRNAGKTFGDLQGAVNAAETTIVASTAAIAANAAALAAKAADSAVVHLTGIETISGAKTFTAPIVGSVTGNAATATTAGTISGSITESQVTGLPGDLSTLTTAVAAKAPLASPTFTGTPAAPTATVGTNTTQLATTAFVLANQSSGSGTVTTVSASVPSGLSVSVTNPATTPAISVTTTLNGLVKGTGAGFTTATAGTDFLSPSGNGSSLTGLTYAQIAGLNTAALHPVSDFLQTANNLSDLASATTARTNLGLGTIATQAAGAVAITGGTIAGTHTGDGSGLTALAAGNIASGTVATARLGSGTASSTTFLRGDSAFANPLTVGKPVAGGGTNLLIYQDASGNLATSTQFAATAGTNPIFAVAADASHTFRVDCYNYTAAILTWNSPGTQTLLTSYLYGGLQFGYSSSNFQIDQSTDSANVRFFPSGGTRGVRVENTGGEGLQVNGSGTLGSLVRKSSTSTLRPAGYLDATLATTTDASWKGRLVGSAGDFTSANAGLREGWRVESDGTQPLLSFYGATAAAKPTVSGSRGGNAALASLLTALAALGLVTDSTTA